MSINRNKIALGFADHMFLTLQTDESTFEKPTASDTIFLAGDANFQQEPVFAGNDEKRDSYAQQEDQVAFYKAGTFSFPVNLKLSGTKGVQAPVAGILKSVFGRETINASTDVTYQSYQRTDNLIFASAIIVKDFEHHFLTGLAFSKLNMKIDADKKQKLELSGMYIRDAVAGVDELESEIDGTTTPVTSFVYKSDDEVFEPGAYVVVGDDDNSGGGHKILAVNTSTRTITIDSPGVTTLQAAGAIIEGWAPVATASGFEVVGEEGMIRYAIDGGTQEDISTTSVEFSLDNGIKALENEKKDTLYPARLVHGKRKVEVSIQKYYTVSDVQGKALLEKQKKFELELNVGNEEGKILQIVCQNAKLKSRSFTGNEEVSTTIKFTCYENSGNDEAKMILK